MCSVVVVLHKYIKICEDIEDIMNLLNRDDILNAADMSSEVIEVPEWGGAVMVKSLTGAERDHFEASIVERAGKKTKMNMANVRARLVALTVVDEDHKRLFRFADVEALGQKSASALDRIFDVAMRLSGMRNEDVEELIENFTSDPSGNSISD